MESKAPRVPPTAYPDNLRGRRFGSVEFDPGFLGCIRADGSRIEFTRQERAVLQCLILHAGRMCSRTQLLSARAETGRSATLRSIDLLINRLRAKLGDDARRPAMIVTQYGEGYIWVAAEDLPVPPDAFLLICPSPGGWNEDAGPEAFGCQAALVQRVWLSLNARLGSPSSVSVALATVSASLPPRSHVRYVLEVGLFEDPQGMHVALALRNHPQTVVLATLRHLSRPQRDDSAFLADWACKQVWRHMLLPSQSGHEAAELPMELRVHEAVRLLGRTLGDDGEAAAQLTSLRAERPQDPAPILLEALYLYSKLLQPVRPEIDTPFMRERYEREIEQAVLTALPLVSGQPLLQLAAARLLCFLGVEHGAFAERLAAEAFAQSTAFAAAHSTRGQIMLCQGDTAAASRLFDHAIRLAKRGSAFHVYLLFLKCQTRMCEGRYAEAEAVLNELYEVKPTARYEVGLVLIPATWHKLPPDLSAVISSLTPALAARILEYLDRMAACQLTVREQRCNLLRGPVRQLTARFGLGIVPQRVRDDLAAELQSVPDSRR